MSDATRPLALGYIHTHALMTDPEVAETKQRLVRFAHAEGYTLGMVYVDQTDNVAAFNTLLTEVHRLEAKAVLVLSLPTSMREHLEHYTGARIVIAHTSP